MSKPGPGDPVARDQDATAFSKHLETLLHELPEAICAVFVDGEGETGDLASRVEPFEARIAGAEMSIVLHGLRIVRAKLGEGALIELRIEGTTRSILVRHVSVGYDLVVLLAAAAISARAAEVTAAMAVTLLNEAGLKPPPGGFYDPVHQYFLSRWQDPRIPEYDLETDELVYQSDSVGARREDFFADAKADPGLVLR